jgi:hypothetical protein
MGSARSPPGRSPASLPTTAKSTGTVMFLKSYRKHQAGYVGRNQRSHQYKLQQEGKTSPMTPFVSRKKAGFEWQIDVAIWEDRLSELADYRKIHGHCNVLQNYSENSKLATWVGTQRNNTFHREGETSYMTNSESRHWRV